MLDVRFAAALDELRSPLSAPFALAVSGGGDSIALMHLAADWLRARDLPLGGGTVLTVDHGLRAGSRRDAELVAEWARRAGFPVHILNWRGAKPCSNIEDAARTARYRLIGKWCRTKGVASIVVAHTRDDQAETFLLRLGRGSGIDGLAAMRARAPFPLPGHDGLELIRPLLGTGREELRAYLAERDRDWLNDPMNEDPSFARVRIRQVRPALEAAGVSTTRIVQAAQHMSRAREALDSKTERFLSRHVRFSDEGTALIDVEALRSQPREIGLRAVSAVLMRVSGRTYRPRFERLESLYGTVVAGGSARTLSNCLIGKAPPQSRPFGTATVEVRREPKRRRLPEAKVRPKDGCIASLTANSPKKGRDAPRLSGT